MSSLHAWPRALVAVSLIVVLMAPPTHAQGTLEQYTWSQAQNLKSGTPIMLTLTDTAPGKVKVQVWHVGDSMRVTTPVTPPPKLPRGG